MAKFKNNSAVYIIRFAALFLLLLLCLFFPTVHSFTKFLFVISFLLAPILIETAALLFEFLSFKSKKAIFKYVSFALRIAILAVITFSLAIYSKSMNDNTLKRATAVYSSITSEALVGIPEDETTKYTESTYDDYDVRPPVFKNDCIVFWGKTFDFGKLLDIILLNEEKDSTSDLKIDFSYTENFSPLLEDLAKKMSVNDIKRIYREIDESCWESYTTEDGYTCISYYQNRKHEYANMYSLIIVGNGKLLTADLEAILFGDSFDFDEMNIDEYYIDCLRNDFN